MRVRRHPRHLAAVAIAFAALVAAGCNTSNAVPPQVLPAAAATPTPVPSGAPSGGPTVTPTPTARPSSSATATPTAVPTATPTRVPTATPTPTPGPTIVPSSCSASPAVIGSTYYTVTAIGSVPAGGGAFTQISGIWFKEMFSAATPAPTPTPSVTPTPGPPPTPPPTRPIYVFTGTYQITSTSAPTTGCLTIFATVDGTTIAGLKQGSAIASGAPKPPSGTFSVAFAGQGAVTGITLTLSPTSPNTTGTIALDDGDTGTITINSVTTVQLPLSRIRKPF
jgi:hypothetical protein